ncbi:MAG TPA: hypothetical protein VEB66_02635 [Opitutaceae bacterium]|nr:hypothetical protein [Opitutaceae bacterium]
MSPCFSLPPIRVLAALACVAAGVVLSGCATTAHVEARQVAPTTGRILTDRELRGAVPGAILGERVYAEVNSAWLPRWYRTYREQLFKIGLTRWDSRFDCNRFADFYSNLAQAFFSLEMFHSNTPAQALALGPFWYVRADGGGSHAIVQAVTERGRIFIDPQTGEEMKLSALEQQSGYVQLF